MTHIKQLMSVLIATTALAVGASAAMAESHGAKIIVVGGKADDPFWSKVKKGAEDAGLVAKATGGSVTWLVRRPTTTSARTRPSSSAPR